MKGGVKMASKICPMCGASNFVCVKQCWCCGYPKSNEEIAIVQSRMKQKVKRNAG